MIPPRRLTVFFAIAVGWLALGLLSTVRAQTPVPLKPMGDKPVPDTLHPAIPDTLHPLAPDTLTPPPPAKPLPPPFSYWLARHRLDQRIGGTTEIPLRPSARLGFLPTGDLPFGVNSLRTGPVAQQEEWVRSTDLSGGTDASLEGTNLGPAGLAISPVPSAALRVPVALADRLAWRDVWSPEGGYGPGLAFEMDDSMDASPITAIDAANGWYGYRHLDGRLQGGLTDLFLTRLAYSTLQYDESGLFRQGYRNAFATVLRTLLSDRWGLEGGFFSHHINRDLLPRQLPGADLFPLRSAGFAEETGWSAMLRGGSLIGDSSMVEFSGVASYREYIYAIPYNQAFAQGLLRAYRYGGRLRGTFALNGNWWFLPAISSEVTSRDSLIPGTRLTGTVEAGFRQGTAERGFTLAPGLERLDEGTFAPAFAAEGEIPFVNGGLHGSVAYRTERGLPLDDSLWQTEIAGPGAVAGLIHGVDLAVYYHRATEKVDWRLGTSARYADRWRLPVIHPVSDSLGLDAWPIALGDCGASVRLVPELAATFRLYAWLTASGRYQFQFQSGMDQTDGTTARSIPSQIGHSLRLDATAESDLLGPDFRGKVQCYIEGRSKTLGAIWSDTGNAVDLPAWWDLGGRVEFNLIGLRLYLQMEDILDQRPAEFVGLARPGRVMAFGAGFSLED